LMVGSGKSLKGAPLMNFVASDADDQERFRAGIDSNVQPEGGSRAGMFAGRLRDALGNSIAIMVYHVPYHTISAQVHHLIGFREDSDGAFAKAPRLPDAVLADTVAEHLASLVSRSPSSNSSRASSVPGWHTLTADVVVAEGLPIRGASQNFRESFCGQAPPGDFSDLVPGDGDRLAAWIREKADLVRCGAVAAPLVETFGAADMHTGAGVPTKPRGLLPAAARGGGHGVLREHPHQPRAPGCRTARPGHVGGGCAVGVGPAA